MNTIVVWAIIVLPILGSSSGPFQSIVRCRDDDSCGVRGEKKQACLMLLRLDPLAHRPIRMFAVGRTARVECVFFPIQRNTFQRE